MDTPRTHKTYLPLPESDDTLIRRADLPQYIPVASQKGTGPFHAALVKQSQWNARAAICAALAAFIQAISLAGAN